MREWKKIEGFDFKEIIFEELVHSSMKSYVASEVFEQTEEPLVLAIDAFFLTCAEIFLPRAGCIFPCAEIFEILATFRKEVENKQVAYLQIGYHLGSWILVPSLYHPDSMRIGSLHRTHQGFSCLAVIHRSIVAAFMEWVHGVVIGFAVESGQLLII